ncbi:TetR family transcriptional regulator [Myxococcus stipitatus DSM 14675]|uniref:TetR family transcriptional regulator n=1 Tax=Myxococcus stipitatus (strain DSM 14675 / JCM 12634 / Mx s8) TaxID=1278073 RepID=L7UFS8_MYXSD|nr:TetR/AcrR family transcriptional regulator [Myxococcus stipitatus]AGC45309.1 TetR family transcriptional regulator [Myxococcus stipitatus DSM 14675]
MSSDPRTAILDAAGEIFVRYGFKKASVEDIARKAGVGKGSIYLHFESKEALFEACARKGHAEALADLKEMVRSRPTPTEQLRAYIHYCIRPQCWSPTGQRIELATLVEIGEQAKQLIPGMVVEETDILTAVLEKGIAAGEFSVAEPRQVARGLVELMYCVGIESTTREPEAQRQRALEACFEVWLQGLSVARSPKG